MTEPETHPPAPAPPAKMVRTGRCAGYKCACENFALRKKLPMSDLCTCNHVQQTHAAIPQA